MSSGTGVHFSHNLGTYSSIKYLVDIYSRTLSREHHDKIDIMSVRPFAVKTSMLKMKARGACITPKQCVVGALRDLGYGDASFA
jgi:short-subunit dehydrogenase